MPAPLPSASRSRRSKRAIADDAIEAGLRRLWANVEAEPVPDDLLDLITRIDALQAATNKGGGAEQ